MEECFFELVRGQGLVRAVFGGNDGPEGFAVCGVERAQAGVVDDVGVVVCWLGGHGKGCVEAEGFVEVCGGGGELRWRGGWFGEDWDVSALGRVREGVGNGLAGHGFGAGWGRGDRGEMRVGRVFWGGVSDRGDGCVAG